MGRAVGARAPPPLPPPPCSSLGRGVAPGPGGTSPPLRSAFSRSGDDGGFQVGSGCGGIPRAVRAAGAPPAGRARAGPSPRRARGGWGGRRGGASAGRAAPWAEVRGHPGSPRWEEDRVRSSRSGGFWRARVPSRHRGGRRPRGEGISLNTGEPLPGLEWASPACFRHMVLGRVRPSSLLIVFFAGILVSGQSDGVRFPGSCPESRVTPAVAWGVCPSLDRSQAGSTPSYLCTGQPFGFVADTCIL